ncbi:MAG: hypothetical protein HY454_03650 [Parcubacteria group bacterium]|nr:hypothetical protein [Parcubacteria group bacterium]
MKRSKNNHLFADFLAIVFGITVAVFLAKTGLLVEVLTASRKYEMLASFLAGIFFVSIFTVAPAGVILAQLAQANSIWLVSLFGAAGALFGDLVIFKFARDRLSQDFLEIVGRGHKGRLRSFFRRKVFRWVMPLIGAFIVASPLPDEVGLTMMGLSKIRTGTFVPLVFVLDFLGILVLGLMVKGLL